MKLIYRTDWQKIKERDQSKLWIDKNENSDEILNRINFNYLKNVDHKSIFAYPDLGRLYKSLAKFLKLKIDNIMLSAGADGAIKSVFENFTKKGDGILRFEPTFAMYSIYPKIYGLKDIVINYTKSKNGPYLDQEVFLKKIKKSKPKLICIANPNSPTGTILKKNEMIKVFHLAKKIKSIILLDEAYYPYYKHTYKSLINKFDNLVIVRTTKSFGMSGMRVGYLISNKKIVQFLKQSRQLYEINNLGAKLFLHLIKNYKFVKASIKRLENGKSYFISEMKKLNFDLLPGNANFLHVNFGKKRGKILKNLRKISYIREIESHPSLKNYSRITLTSKSNFKKIVKQVKNAIKKRYN